MPAKRKKPEDQTPAPLFAYFRNESPQGALQVPMLGVEVARGAVIKVPAHLAPSFAGQEVWVPVDAEDANNDESLGAAEDANNDESLGDAEATPKE